MTDEYIELSKKAFDSLDEERPALKELSLEKSIIITDSDKGNAVVIQNVEDYRRKIGEILATKGRFAGLDNDPTVDREKYIYDLLHRIG